VTPLALVEHLILSIHNRDEDGAILVFLPGWDEISKIFDSLKEKRDLSHTWKLFPLHSMVPTSQQRDVFKRPPPGVRKIVLATNIAESSLTIDDVVFVLDSGKYKEKTYDAENKIGCLLPAWISQASSRQRRGRAGRVQPGKCWHLFPRRKLETLAEYQLPEMLRTPLEQMCLQVRSLNLAKDGAGGIACFLQRAVTPPSSQAVSNALDTLLRIGALRKDTEQLTVLGQYLSLLPMEPQIAKSLVMASVLGCLDSVLTITCLLSQRSPFVLPPREQKRDADAAKQRIGGGSRVRSDHFAILNAYHLWKGSSDPYSFCRSHFLSSHTLRTAEDMKQQFIDLLAQAGLLPQSSTRGDSTEDDYNRNGRKWPVVKAALTAGMYPNLVRVDCAGGAKSRARFYTKDHGLVKLHPGSVNEKHRDFQYYAHRWLVYNGKVKTLAGLFIHDTSEASPIALAIFGTGEQSNDPLRNGRC
jgi:ATP-dependent RNA helicase DHX36